MARSRAGVHDPETRAHRRANTPGQGAGGGAIGGGGAHTEGRRRGRETVRFGAEQRMERGAGAARPRSARRTAERMRRGGAELLAQACMGWRSRRLAPVELVEAVRRRGARVRGAVEKSARLQAARDEELGAEPAHTAQAMSAPRGARRAAGARQLLPSGVRGQMSERAMPVPEKGLPICARAHCSIASSWRREQPSCGTSTAREDALRGAAGRSVARRARRGAAHRGVPSCALRELDSLPATRRASARSGPHAGARARGRAGARRRVVVEYAQHIGHLPALTRVLADGHLPRAAGGRCAVGGGRSVGGQTRLHGR